MADADETTVTFDLFSTEILNENSNILENLTEEEMTEVNHVVTLLETAEKNSLDDFEDPQETELRHKPVTDNELDRLASKNNANTTGYQTRWAVAVMKGAFILILSFITHFFSQNMILSSSN